MIRSIADGDFVLVSPPINARANIGAVSELVVQPHFGVESAGKRGLL